MKSYTSHKVVQASKIVATLVSPASIGVTLVLEDKEQAIIDAADYTRMHKMGAAHDSGSIYGGYLIKYPDGYLSWSPAEAFEGGYKETENISGAPTKELKEMGYKELTEKQIDGMKKVKEVGKRLGELHEELSAFGEVDPRWLATGKTDLQKGLMALTRSIAQPEFF